MKRLKLGHLYTITLLDHSWEEDIKASSFNDSPFTLVWTGVCVWEGKTYAYLQMEDQPQAGLVSCHRLIKGCITKVQDHGPAEK